MSATSIDSKRQRSGRQPIKQNYIFESLRDEILSNRLVPGDRLPTRLQLEEKFNCSSVTIQRAVNQLLEDGFVVAHGRNGTFVAEAPPHLCEFALVFLNGRESREWTRLDELLFEQAPQVSDCRDYNLQLFDNLFMTDENEAAVQLTASLAARRLAGMIMIGWDEEVASHVSRLDPELPIICVTDQAISPGVPRLQLGAGPFLAQAMTAVRKSKRRMPAVLLPTGCAVMRETIVALAAKENLDFKPYAIQAQDPHAAGWCQPQVQLLLQQPAGKRPDALIVADERLVPPVYAALNHAGIVPGQDLALIVHGDYPCEIPANGGAICIGYDSWEILDMAVKALQQLKAGEEQPASIDVPAHRWTNEVPHFLQA